MRSFKVSLFRVFQYEGSSQPPAAPPLALCTVDAVAVDVFRLFIFNSRRILKAAEKITPRAASPVRISARYFFSVVYQISKFLVHLESFFSFFLCVFVSHPTFSLSLARS